MHVSKEINISEGDIIETDGKSPVFPEGIIIGKVVSKGIDETGEMKVQVRLKQDFANLAQAYVVTNLNKVEIQQVEKSDTITSPKNVQ